MMILDDGMHTSFLLLLLLSSCYSSDANNGWWSSSVVDQRFFGLYVSMCDSNPAMALCSFFPNTCLNGMAGIGFVGSICSGLAKWGAIASTSSNVGDPSTDTIFNI